jgi:hypothetical protein
MTFGRFLSAQTDRDDWIGELARSAAKDRRFPWAAEPIDQHDHIGRHLGGNADVLHAFQAALDEWHGEPYSLHRDMLDREREVRERALAAYQAKVDAEEEVERARRNARRRELNAGRKGQG